jgi:hypothetical protein
MVIADHRGSGLAIRLVAGAYAIARWLGLDTIVATVGIRDGQAGILRRIGGRCGSGLASLRSSLFDDDLAFMYFDVTRPSASLTLLIDEMTPLLGIDFT